MVSLSLLACDDESFDTDLTELRSTSPTEPRLREGYDPDDLIFVDDLTLHVVVDPLTAPMDISTGVINGSATVFIDGALRQPAQDQAQGRRPARRADRGVNGNVQRGTGR